MKNYDYTFVKADKDLFAVYQTIHSGEDLELWFDWKSRLEDTKWTDNCFWLIKDNDKIAGAIINNETVMYPFLISPFCHRTLFWREIHRNLMKENHMKINTNGIFDDDVNILLTFGYKIERIRQMMCRPTDIYSLNLSQDFYYRSPEMKDISLIAEAKLEGYKGGIDYQVFGEPTLSEENEDTLKLLNIYDETNSLSNSIIVFDKKTDMLAGLCISGLNNKMPLGFAEISELCVLPQYRNRGLAEFMIKYVISKAHEKTPLIKLCVTVGNSAESLYRKMGFVAGARFTNMSYQPSINVT